MNRLCAVFSFSSFRIYLILFCVFFPMASVKRFLYQNFRFFYLNFVFSRRSYILLRFPLRHFVIAFVEYFSNTSGYCEHNPDKLLSLLCSIPFRQYNSISIVSVLGRHS